MSGEFSPATTALPQWHRARVNSLGRASGSSQLIPTRFIFEKIESTHRDSTGYDVRELDAAPVAHGSPSTVKVLYRSTFQIFVNADDADYGRFFSFSPAIPEVDGSWAFSVPPLSVPGASVDFGRKRMQSDGTDGKSEVARRSVRSRLQSILDCSTRCAQSLLQKNYTLPENPTIGQKIWEMFLCPPHGVLAIFLTKILIALLVWLTLWSFFGENALPNGEFFALFILIVGAFLGGFFISLAHLPPLLGMLIVGFLLRNVPGINFAGDISAKYSSVLRNFALTVILIRAGLGLDGTALKKLSKSVFLLSFLPCLAETASVGVAARLLLGFPWLWAFLLGFVQAAVSPAVLVPFMLNLQEIGLGTKQGIPTLLIAASSLDDVLAISGFSVLLSVIFSQGAALWFQIIQGPLEMLMGLAYGIFIGFIFWYLPHRHHGDLSTLRFVLLLLGGLVGVFGSKTLGFPGAGALAALTAAFVAGHKWRSAGWDVERVKAAEIFSYLWTFCQPILFGLIGAEVVLENVHLETVGLAVAVMVITIIVRMAFTVLAVSFAGLNFKERLFVAIAWVPKATVQAALGSLALDTARELNAGPDVILLGEKVVTIAVLLIIITAPLGAVGISLSAPRLLQQEENLSPEKTSERFLKNRNSKADKDLEMTGQNSGEEMKFIDAPEV